ncbi:MAG: antibiotic biosynthesis monooxygenase [Coleofasciculaceae cyanobacterium SM2_3_26]|nr:antibiotic biosynthesis monooxygenase [Coleofasciculaceae cyanobacterium SM2_3_26]
MNSEPVTAIISRKVAVHLRTEFEAWQADISQAASQFPGYQGVTVLRPASPEQSEYVVILRFDSYANLANWETSDTRQGFLYRGDKLFGSRVSVQRYIGMALWFAPPSVPQPPRYKMVLLLTCTIFTLSLVTAPLFDRLLGLLPPLLQNWGDRHSGQPYHLLHPALVNATAVSLAVQRLVASSVYPQIF